MYLDPETVDNTFNVINQFASSGDEVVFDYVYSSVLRGENLYYGESEVLKQIEKTVGTMVFWNRKGRNKTIFEG